MILDFKFKNLFSKQKFSEVNNKGSIGLVVSVKSADSWFECQSAFSLAFLFTFYPCCGFSIDTYFVFFYYFVAEILLVLLLPKSISTIFHQCT